MSEQIQLREYVDVNEGTQLLGTTQHKFLYHVSRGNIAIEPGSERRSRRYKVSDILAVKERLKTKKRKPAPILIDWVASSDLPVALKLSQQVYDEEVDLVEAAVYQGWRRNNQQLTIGAFTPNRSECLATIQLVPLDESVILDVLAGRRMESSITPDEVQSYDRPGAYTLLCTSVTALPSKPFLLYELLYRYMQFWIAMYPERYIKKIYAQGVSERGMMLIQHVFMTPRRDLAFNAYELDLAWPAASKIVRTFKAALEEKAPLPEELQWLPVEQVRVTESITPEPEHADLVRAEPATAPFPTPQRRTRAAAGAHAVTHSEMPEGSLALKDFADQLGINRSTLHEQVTKYDLSHIAIPKQNRPGESDRYFTPDQQEAIKAWRASRAR